MSNVNTYLVDKDSIHDRILKLIATQTAKGINKYGHTLDDCPDDKFDWKLMAMEEMADLIQYQQKEIMRLERVRDSLKTERETLERLLNP